MNTRKLVALLAIATLMMIAMPGFSQKEGTQTAREQRICYDRYLPGESYEDHIRHIDSRGAIIRAKLWDTGATLKVGFIGGTTSQRNFAKAAAAEWESHANIKFQFVTSGTTDIRIAFNSNDGAWSYLGTDCSNISQSQATMNLGWTTGGVGFHEFGHTLGMIHEHQNPNGGINWDRDAVIADLSGPPNNWDLATIEHNMFTQYSASSLNSTSVDPNSIMMYTIPNSWTLDNFSTTTNNFLSSTDKSFIGNADNYPFGSGGGCTTYSGSLSGSGDSDVQPNGTYYQTTSSGSQSATLSGPGSADFDLELYRWTGSWTKVASSTSGSSNETINYNGAAGYYYWKVLSYNGSGSYTLCASHP